MSLLANRPEPVADAVNAATHDPDAADLAAWAREAW